MIFLRVTWKLISYWIKRAGKENRSWFFMIWKTLHVPKKNPSHVFRNFGEIKVETSNFIQELQVLYSMQGLVTNSFIMFPFCKNSLLCLEGKIMIPCRGNMYFSLSCLPATPLFPSHSLEGLFELAPITGPRLTLCVATGTTEKQGQHWVCRLRRWGPRTP